MIDSEELLAMEPEGILYGRNLIPSLCCLVINAQTVAPNHINSARHQQLHPGYFGLTFAQWEELATCRPSFPCGREYKVYG